MATGDHDWVTGEAVTAANVDDYIQLQVVAQYATAAARDTALSARKREGMVTHQADVNTLTAYSGAAWSTVGPVHGALTAWTPAVVQLGSVTVTNTSSAYTRTGRWVSGHSELSVTGTGTAANNITISLPVTAANDNRIMGTGRIMDLSVGSWYYFGFIMPASATTVYIQPMNNGAISGALGATTFTAALAAGDLISVQFAYEAAGDA